MSSLTCRRARRGLARVMPRHTHALDRCHGLKRPQSDSCQPHDGDEVAHLIEAHRDDAKFL